MPRELTHLKEKDYKLLKKESTSILGGSGGPYAPAFGNSVKDYIQFHVYDMSDRYLKSGTSEDFENKDDKILVKPGNDLRRIGFTRGDFKVKYFFHRRIAGADEVILTKTVGDESGVVHSGNPQITGVPMGSFYVDEDGKAFVGEKPPVDGSRAQELDIKEYKFFIDTISADRKEVRLAPQVINLNKYKEEFFDLGNEYGMYKPIKNVTPGGDTVTGVGKYESAATLGFEFDSKANIDPGFHDKYVGGTLEVKDAFIVGYTEQTDTTENPNWSLEDPIPSSYIEAYDLKESGFPMAVRYVVKDESTQKTLGGHDFEGYQPIPNLITPGIRYHFDFGCGHTEITDTPFANHTYDTDGTYNPTVTIMTPNFTEVLSDVYSNTNAPQNGPGLRGSKLSGFVPTPEITATEQAQSTDLEYMPNGTIVRYWQTYWLIDGGKKRFIVSYGHGSPDNIDDYLPVNIDGVYDTNAEATLYNLMVQKGAEGTPWGEWHGNEQPARQNRQDFSLPLSWAQQNVIPDGPPFTSTDFAATDSTADGEPRQWVLPDPFPIVGNENPEGDDTDDDTDDSDTGQQYLLQLSINAFISGDSVDLPYSTSSTETGPGTEMDAYWKINGDVTNLTSFSGMFNEGEEVEVEVVVDSYPDGEYGFIMWEQPDQGSPNNPRTIIMNGDKDKTARIGITF